MKLERPIKESARREGFYLGRTCSTEWRRSYQLSNCTPKRFFMSTESRPQQASQPSKGRSAILIVGVILIAAFSIAFAGYTTMNPHTMTVTQQQLVTNTQSIYNTQTVTAVSTLTPATSTSAATTVIPSTTSSMTAAAASTIMVTQGGYGFSNCGPSGCYPSSLGAYGTMCQSLNQNGTLQQCSGYLYQPSNGGCMKLAIPYINPDVLETTAYVYYTLQNLPSSTPPTGSWVTVTGQVYSSYTIASSGNSCGGSYIQVQSIS